MFNYQRLHPIYIPLNHYKIPLHHYKIPLNTIELPIIETFPRKTSYCASTAAALFAAAPWSCSLRERDRGYPSIICIDILSRCTCRYIYIYTYIHIYIYIYAYVNISIEIEIDRYRYICTEYI